MQISIIIPTLNEAEQIGQIIDYLYQNSHSENIAEILIIDGDSHDETVKIAETKGARVISSDKGRAVQMNVGAREARGDILYFLHADTVPPTGFDKNILFSIEMGYCSGSFLHSFDYEHPVLRFTSWLVNKIPRTRMGDQSLFVKKQIFNDIAGFDEKQIIMEDVGIAHRLMATCSFKLHEEKIITSARKFRENGELRLFLIFALIYTLYEFNISQKHLLSIYKTLIRQNKI